MKEEEISKIFFSEPEALFSMIKENGGSLDFFKKLNLAKEMTRERFPDLINIKYEDAIDFLFWFIYAMENEVRDTILYVEDELGKERVKTEKMIDDMTFGMKVDFIENNYVSNKNNDIYISFMRRLNKLRNHMSHGRLHELKYGGYFLSEPEAQLKIFADARNAHLDKQLVK